MNRLCLPVDDIEISLGACAESIVDPSLKERVDKSLKGMLWRSDEYKELADIGKLYTIEPVDTSYAAEPELIEGLSSEELKTLYSYYLVTRMPGRKVYDRILNSTEECPYCGGIGRPRNLDHFLPKTHYPQFSILPINLIPSCRDCNMDGKRASYADGYEKQFIHPYLDAPKFFDDKWISAEYIPEKGVFHFFACPPESWPDQDKRRVKFHFSSFDIAKRYSREAGSELVILTDMVRNLLGLRLGQDAIKKAIIQPVLDRTLSPNDWKSVMYDSAMNLDLEELCL